MSVHVGVIELNTRNNRRRLYIQNGTRKGILQFISVLSFTQPQAL
uniref:Uncharacterized protein n=1 Tax=Anguilla anguilla TaxID=7936 RepID=A0A0E9SEL9_ANGAN